ncbi:hypothetical protein TNIN_281031 [Trichonephila inaurata madagascariensis]|uniref:Integrase catalytic domain-containing protein n=1 Tax=Trichonephila inaurata madagascariensis TaxID=2747483 RepID=A0A8X6XM72_9ARAC|nr:hypothetical protein TNIN_281031 [Trichonephila inaurata madagascariensis]
MWWEGMDWLRPPEEWPKSNVTPDFDIINSQKGRLRFNLRPKPIVEAPLPERSRKRGCRSFRSRRNRLRRSIDFKGIVKLGLLYLHALFTEAIHLELATSLSTENFLQQTLRRFVLEGRPSIIYWDNGS